MSRKPTYKVPLLKQDEISNWRYDPETGTREQTLGRVVRRRGTLLHQTHVGPYSIPNKFDWVDSFQFDGNLRLVDWHKGRSSVIVILENEHKVQYPMMFAAFYELMQAILSDRAELSADYISGKWKTVKRGTAYGIEYVDEA